MIGNLVCVFRTGGFHGRMTPALLALEDGTIFHGRSFGAPMTGSGEICFNTSMTGYQEVLTDPSYRGQIVAMTYPLIGNYGINAEDVESSMPHVRGFVIEELCARASNWRATGSLNDYLARHGIPGIEGIDTRALTKRLRTGGALRACIAPAAIGESEAVRLACGATYDGVDFVREVTRPSIQSGAEALGEAIETDTPAHTAKIVAYDFGMKRNILRSLHGQGFDITVVPATTPARDVLAMNPDGVFLSNGPGDPAALSYASEAVREILPLKPIFGICLGHQILALALGGRTFKLKFGHRGANQPVKDLRTGRIAITSQNHGFAVDPDSLPPHVEVTHINLNDGTVAGIRHRDQRAFSVQYHPEASPGPHDAGYFFAEFAKEVAESRKSG